MSRSWLKTPPRVVSGKTDLPAGPDSAPSPQMLPGDVVAALAFSDVNTKLTAMEHVRWKGCKSTRAHACTSTPSAPQIALIVSRFPPTVPRSTRSIVLM